MSGFYRRVALPLVDLARRTDSLRVYRELHESQWWDRSKLEHLQFLRLRELLVHAGTRVPYYREVFSQCGFRPEKMQAPSDIAVLPLLTKDILRQEQRRLMAGNASDFQPRPHRSAGTTGQPIVIQMDRARHSIGWADMYRWWSAGGWKLGDKQFVVAGAALRPRQVSGLKARLYSMLNHFEDRTAFDLTEGALVDLLGKLSRAQAPVFLRGYASSIHMLARQAARRNWPGRLAAVFTTAETLFPDQRRAIESGLHAPVFDQWGCRDGGISAFECERHRGLHLAIENAYVEICQGSRPMAVGEAGDVVATDLFSYAMPIIRYRVGDVAAMSSDSCACGRGLPVVASVAGRVSGFLIGSGGKRIHGEFFSHVFWETEWVREFQIVQNRPEEIIVNIIPARSPEKREIDHIHALMQNHAGPQCRVRIEFPPEIPPGPMGKRQFVVCNIPQP